MLLRRRPPLCLTRSAQPQGRQLDKQVTIMRTPLLQLSACIRNAPSRPPHQREQELDVVARLQRQPCEVAQLRLRAVHI